MIQPSLNILGQALPGANGTKSIHNPWNSQVVGLMPLASAQQAEEAIQHAANYKPRLSRFQRSEILRKAADLLVSRTSTYSDLITAESGLCKQDTLYEVGRVRDVLLFGAQAVLQDDGQIFSCDITPHGKARRVYTQRSPLLGVIVAITPFNHPMNQVAHKVVPSVVTNNRMVLKPSEKVPLSAYAFAELLYEAGLPRSMLQVITGHPSDIADTLITHPAVDLVTFTGGVEIGKLIASKVGYKRVILELGGNDPLIIMDDANLDDAALLAATGSYKNSGQRCTAIKRIFVHQKVQREFTDRLVEISRHWQGGDPMNPSSKIGTVIDETAAIQIEKRVESAIAQGAQLLLGHHRSGAYYPPTVLSGVTHAMELVAKETFGPVSPVIAFDTLDEVIAQVNSTPYGLSSAVCTNRLDVITRLVDELEVGSLNVGEVPGYRLELTPFGGIKDSGLGYKEGIQEAVKSFTNIKTYSLPWPM